MIERREYVRINESLKIGYKILKPLDGEGNSISENISGGGMRFPVAHRLTPGTVLDLKIFLPQAKSPIAATGEVVWWQERDDKDLPYVIGVKFVTIDEFDRGKILNYIRQTIQEKAPSDIRWIE